MAEENPLVSFVDSLVEEVFQSPGFQGLDQEQRRSLEEKIKDHFTKMTLDTLISRLSKEQAQELSQVADQDEKTLANKIEELAASVPGLAEDIEERLSLEADQFKRLKGDD